MTVLVGDFMRCVAKQIDSENSVIENTWFVGHNGNNPVDDAVFLDALEDALTVLYTYLGGYMPTSCNPTEIEVDQVAFYSGKLVTLRPVGTQPWLDWPGGVSTSNEMPAFLTAVISFPTQIPRVSGRKSFGPLTSAAIDGNNIDSGLLIGMTNVATAAVAGFTASGEWMQFGIMSTKADTFVAYDSYSLSNLVGHQATRKAGVGM